MNKSMLILCNDDMNTPIVRFSLTRKLDIFIRFEDLVTIMTTDKHYETEGSEYSAEITHKGNTVVCTIISKRNGKVFYFFHDANDVIYFIETRGLNKYKIPHRISRRPVPCRIKFNLNGFKMDQRTRETLRNTARNWGIISDNAWMFPMSSCYIDMEAEKEFFGRTKFNTSTTYKLRNGEIKKLTGELFPVFNPELRGEHYKLTENFV